MIEVSKSKKSKKLKKRIVDSNVSADDVVIQNSIRPTKFADIIGRVNEKETLKMMIDSAKYRNEVLDHILFYGPPGLGKTTFAGAIANEIGSSIRITSGPAIDKQGDLAAILTNLRAHDVLFIDEIHRLSRRVEEILYPAMEDGVLDIVVGKGSSAKTIRIKLQPFTLIGATTQIGSVSSPLRTRFGLVMRLDYFSGEDIVEILRRTAKIWDLKITEDGLKELAGRARGTARVAIRLLKRTRDYAYVNGFKNGIDKVVVEKALELLGIDRLGLEDIDRKILIALYKNFNGGPVGLSTLASAISEDEATTEDVYEPFLIKLGLLKRTSRGRVLTSDGVAFVEDILGEHAQNTLL